MSHFVMSGDQIVVRQTGALLNSGIIDIIQIPSTRMTNNILTRRPHQHTLLPKLVRHRSHAQTSEKLFGQFEYSFGRVVLFHQFIGDIELQSFFWVRLD